MEVPADVSSAICDFGDRKVPVPAYKTHACELLPRHPQAWELMLAVVNTDIGEETEVSGDRQNVHKLLDIPYADWAAMDLASLQPLWNDYRRWEDTRISKH